MCIQCDTDVVEKGNKEGTDVSDVWYRECKHHAVFRSSKSRTIKDWIENIVLKKSFPNVIKEVDAVYKPGQTDKEWAADEKQREAFIKRMKPIKVEYWNQKITYTYHVTDTNGNSPVDIYKEFESAMDSTEALEELKQKYKVDEPKDEKSDEE